MNELSEKRDMDINRDKRTWREWKSDRGMGVEKREKERAVLLVIDQRKIVHCV